MDLDALAAEAGAMAGGDPAHDFAHVMRVCKNARGLCASEGLDPGLAVCAALFHDVVSYPKSDPRSAGSAAESARAAAPVLQRHGLTPEEVGIVAGAIRDHSYSRGAVPETITGMILQDADRLDALGAVGIARAFATGGALGRPLYSPEDPFCSGRRPDDSGWTVDHFYSKLLLLESQMNTEAGRAEARRRTAFLREFLKRLGGEI